MPLQELLDALDETVPGAAESVVHAPPAAGLQPAATSATSFSFDAPAAATARAAVTDPATRPLPEPMTTPLPPLPAGDLDLADLLGFLNAPVKTFVRRRLGVDLLESAEQTTEAIPVELNGLEEWSIGQRMVRDLRAGVDDDHTLQAEWRRGSLPPGKLGWTLARTILGKAKPIAETASAVTRGLSAGAVDVDIELGAGRRLTGTVTDVYDNRVLKVSYSRLGPKHELDAWLALLALEAAHPGRGWTAGALGRGQRDPVGRSTFAGIDDPLAVLRDLVAIYDAGMAEPLPLPVKTSYAWARRQGSRPEVPLDQLLWAGRKDWKSSQDWSKEDALPEHVAVWGPAYPLEDLAAAPPRPGEEHPTQHTRLGALSMRLWGPMLEARYSA